MSALLSLDKPFPTCTHQGHIREREREREDIQQSLRHPLETNIFHKNREISVLTMKKKQQG